MNSGFYTHTVGILPTKPLCLPLNILNCNHPPVSGEYLFQDPCSGCSDSQAVKYLTQRGRAAMLHLFTSSCMCLFMAATTNAAAAAAASVVCGCAHAPVWSSQGHLEELVLSFHLAEAGPFLPVQHTQVSCLQASRRFCLYLWPHSRSGRITDRARKPRFLTQFQELIISLARTFTHRTISLVPLVCLKPFLDH